jgi:hypothetical protein
VKGYGCIAMPLRAPGWRHSGGAARRLGKARNLSRAPKTGEARKLLKQSARATDSTDASSVGRATHPLPHVRDLRLGLGAPGPLVGIPAHVLGRPRRFERWKQTGFLMTLSPLLHGKHKREPIRAAARGIVANAGGRSAHAGASGGVR